MPYRLPKMRRFRLPRLLILLGGLLLPLAAAAITQAEIQQLPYEVKADSATFEQTSGKGIYRGDVTLSRGPQELNADKMTLILDEQRQLQHVEAVGQPVTFTNGMGVKGKADRMIYDVAHQTMQLIGDAHLVQQGRRFSGARLTYDLADKTIKAKGGESGQVHLVLPPEDTKNAAPEGGK